MKYIILILLALTAKAQEPKANLLLSNNQVIINAPSNKNWNSYNVKGFQVYSATDTTIIDDSETDKISYYGSWRNSTTGCKCSFTNKANDSLVINFTDVNSFIWYGELQSHHGIGDIYLNNEYLGEIDTYDSRNLIKTKNWQRHDLDPQKVYKFKIVITGRKNPNSTNTYIVNHGFKMWKNSQAPPVQPPDTVYIRDTIWMIPTNYEPSREKPKR